MKNNTFTNLFVVLLVSSLPLLSSAQENKPMINHVAICAHNLQKSIAFYSDVMELIKIPHPFKDTVHQWYSIGKGAALHIIKGGCPVEAHDINTHLCFSVALLPNFIKHLDEMHVKWGDWGGARKTQLRADGVTQIYFQDPDGYWIEVNDAK